MHFAPLAGGGNSGGGSSSGGSGRGGGAAGGKKAKDLLLGSAGIALAVCLATVSDHGSSKGGGGGGGGSSSGAMVVSCDSASALTVHGGLAPPSGGRGAASGAARNVTTRTDVKKRQRELTRMSTVGGRIEDRFLLGERLGEGGYGTVHMGTDRRTGAVVAVKIMQKKHMGKASFAKEVATLRKIHDAGGHPNIAGVEAIYEDRSNYYLVLELVSGGEMFEHLVRNGAYSEQTAAALVRDLAQGLLFLHSKDIVHADLKPENIMLSSWDDQTAQVKLVDFGCAGATGERWDATATGTTAYWPPEAMSDRGFELTPAMDMWSVGVILYIMLTGMHPYDVSGDTPEDIIMSKVASEDVPTGDDMVGHLSDSAKDLIARLMTRDPVRRLSATQMAEHPWVTGETASAATIDKIDEKLANYRQTLEDKILGSVFSMLVQRSVSVSSNPRAVVAAASQTRAPDSLEDAVDVVKKAFSVFDKEKKGYVNAGDIARVLSEVGEGELTEQESAEVAQALEQRPGDGGSQGISIGSFEEMMSCLGSVKYKAGDYIFREGDPGDYMYFINSGRVDVFKEGKEKNEPCRITTLGPGDLFGEASLITKDPRSASVKCITPVQVVRLGRDSVERIMTDAKGASASLREMAVLREMNRAKAVLRAVGRVVQKSYRPGEMVVRQGDKGTSMFTIVQGDMDVLLTPRRPSGGGKSPRGPVKVASIGPGDIFGEMALMLEQPRNASVVCRGSGDSGCIVKEIQGEDFLQLLQQSPDFHKAMRCLMRTRQFRHDILSLGNQIGVGEQSYSEAELRRVFQEVDQDGSGLITAAELTAALDRLGSKMTAEDVKELLRMGDLRLEGGISFDEFCRVMAWAAS